MELEEKKALTESWIMVMLYKTPMTLDELVINGCRVMVYGWKLEEFRDIINIMVTGGMLARNTTTGKISLTTDGIFFIKQNTLLPLIQVAEEPGLLTSFVEENKEKCDTKFLEELSEIQSNDGKENRVKDFAKNNYEKIAVILIALIPFLLTYA